MKAKDCVAIGSTLRNIKGIDGQGRRNALKMGNATPTFAPSC